MLTMIQFQVPMALWALSAMILPVLLHWWHRQQQQPEHFYALRFLPAEETPVRHRRLHDPWLLLLRMLILALLALWLAEPTFSWSPTRERDIELVHPRAELPDENQHSERYWLCADGLRPIREPRCEEPALWLSLLRHQQALADVRQITLYLPEGLLLTGNLKPSLPYQVVLQRVAATTLFSPAPIRIAAPVSWQPAIDALNALRLHAIWQRVDLSTESPVDIAVHRDDLPAAVHWYPQPFDAQSDSGLQSLQQNRVLYLAPVPSDPNNLTTEVLAELIDRSETWLRQWQPAALSDNASIQPHFAESEVSSFSRTLPLQNLLMVLLLLAIVIERGISYGRR
ncbi:BatA domain-containing protein [Permianibacter aggregans]|uniref:Putative membrane protein (TIGR02226 family) n=1 Tax=Permianibacter aggregans TaxID=1510150 RepID=A0A4R6UMU9_9GAMM|nr:BatA domain-containing protein [Permianibacter aggregans]QGX38990.1 hypothetical protein E2H98_04660 [Permianibacter aggregans]TDQ46763.1 putative membrane protein (TIGR02226 family) [Permianibacter aggregans]